MKLIKNENYNNIMNLINKKVKFISDCELFDNFNIDCIIYNIYINNNEYIFDVVELKNHKNLKIGSNMKNLKYSLL